jgi:hypothetical protein
VSWLSQLWCVDDGDGDELVVTTTMANMRMVACGGCGAADVAMDGKT